MHAKHLVSYVCGFWLLQMTRLMPPWREIERTRKTGAKQAKATFQQAHRKMLQQRAREAQRRDG